MYSNEVVNFGVFERDTLPDPKLIATSIEQFEEEVKEKSRFGVVKMFSVLVGRMKAR